MAESVGDLFIRMGVDTSELDSGFVSAERTVTENLARLNREQHMIQIRGQIELDGLEETASASEKVRVQAEALTKQMEIQRDKIAMVSTAYEDLRSRYGETSEITQQAALALEQERLAMSNLQKQTQELSKQQEIALGVNVEMLGLIPSAIKGVEMLIAAGHAIPIPHAKAAAGVATALLAVAAGSAEATMELREENPAKVLDEEFAKAESGISGSWEQIENDTKNASGEIKDATAEINESISEMGESAEETADEVENVLDLLQTEDVGDAIKKANDLFEESDSILGRLGKTILGIAGTISAFEASMIKAAQPAIEGFRELSTTAKELNLSLDATNDLLAKVKLAGADFDDVRDYVRGVQDAVIKGDSTDPEVIALEKYGVAIQDANGNLLAFDETLDRLYQGYLKAREAGEAEAYAMMTNGQAVKDILPYFESLAKAEEDRAKIQWSVTDAASLEQASRDLRLMETQIDEFKNALSSLAVPAADIAIKETFEMFKKGTQLIEENRETIVFWSFVVMEAIQSVKKIGGEAADWVLEKLSAAADTLKELNKRFGLTEKASGLFDAAAEKIGSLKTAIFGESTAEAESFIDRAKKDTEEYIDANEKARAETEKTAEAITAGLSYSYNRIAQYKDELAGIKIDLQFGDDKLGAELAKLEQWHQKALRDARYYEEERAVLAELYAAKREQIERKAAEEIAKAREEAQKRITESLRNAADIEYNLTHDALEKQLKDIERWKEAQLEKAQFAQEIAAAIAQAAMQEAQAVQDAINKMQGKTTSLQDQLARKTMSQREYDKYQARKQYQENLKNSPKVLADAIYRATLNEIAKKTAEAQARADSARRQRETAEAKGEKYTGDRGNEINQYTKSPGLGSSALAYIDPRRIATKEVLDRLRISVDEAKKALEDSGGSSEKLRENLQELAKSRGLNAENFNAVLKSAGNGVNQFSDSVADGATGVTSAVDTLKLALENAARIEEINAEREAELLDRDSNPNRIKIIYGDDEEYQPRRGGARIIYGDEDNDYADMGAYDLSPEEMLREFIGELDDSLIDGLEGLFGQVEPQVAEPLDKLGESANTATTPINQLGEATGEVAAAGNEAAEKLLNAADAMDKAREILLQSPMAQPQAQQEIDDAIQKALGGTATIGEIIAAAGAVTLQPEVAAIGAVIQALADTAAGLREMANQPQSPQIPQQQYQPLPQQQPAVPDMSALTQELQNQSSTLGEIKTAVQEIQQQAAQSASDDNQSLIQSISDTAQQITQSITEAIQQAAQSLTETMHQFPQQATETANQIAQSISEMNQHLAQTATESVQQVTQTLSEISQGLSQSLSEATQSVMTAITEQTNQMVQALGIVSQAMAESARALTESRATQNPRSAPTVSPTVNNNINLGGAYVFDNSMKRQLTDDIAGEVANAVTSAVQSFASRESYGYAT